MSYRFAHRPSVHPEGEHGGHLFGSLQAPPGGRRAGGFTDTGASAMTGWTVTFILPAGHTLTGSWNGAVTVSGRTVTVRNAAHNGALAPGAATTFGFRATRPNGDTAYPSGYTCS
ncbi:cellulose binding domain-containing protein [Nonomuraea bangladeshensis]|uniref:cellulose binding domain-containing protein n=1 Tax=Nonomuraea bangladeshensis TaxID=404385 RepID=UPI003C2DB64D